MRVLFLGPYPPPFGGVQTHLVNLRSFIQRHGVRSHVVNITGTRRETHDDVHYPASAPDVVRLLAHLDYDLIHLHLGGDLTPRLLGLLAVSSLVPRTRTIMTFHSGGYPRSPAGLTARPASLRGLVFRRLDALVAVNAELIELFRRFGARPDRCHLIPPHSFPRGAGDGTSIQLPETLEAFFASHAVVLLSVGLLEPEYDLPLQIRALGELRRHHPDAGLLLIGSGAQHSQLQELIARQPYREHVLLAGDVAHPVTLAAIARARVLLRTTLYDGDAISVRESLHLRTPVVATDNGMRPEGTRLFPIGDLPALVRAISDVLDAQARGVDAITGTAERSGEENLKAVLLLYEQVLGQRPGQRPRG